MGHKKLYYRTEAFTPKAPPLKSPRGGTSNMSLAETCTPKGARNQVTKARNQLKSRRPAQQELSKS